MNHIPEDTLVDLETALRAERAALEEELATYGKHVDSEGEEDWEASSGSEGEEAAPEDVADNIEELVTNVPLVSELESRRKDIVDAMKRLAAGTYGTCEECGDEIDVARLEANPAARTCILHAH
jgi:RNA polymerase-binding transcription factor DksA